MKQTILCFKAEKLKHFYYSFYVINHLLHRVVNAEVNILVTQLTICQVSKR